MRTVSGQDLSGRLEQRTVVALGISARRGAGVGIGIDLGPGSLAPIAGIIDVTQEMAARSRQGDEAVEAVVARAQAMTPRYRRGMPLRSRQRTSRR